MKHFLSYNSVNDASRNTEVKEENRKYFGTPEENSSNTVEVWYAKNPTFTSKGNFISNETHTLLGVVKFENKYIDDLYWAFQGENWSPNGEANALIRNKGLHHTSMSVGDVFVSHRNSGTKEIVMVASVGFKQLNLDGTHIS